MKNPFKQNKHEIKYNLINSFLAGFLVFLGSLTTGNLDIKGIMAGLLASLIIICSKFKEYWTTQETEYKKTIKNLFNFI